MHKKTPGSKKLLAGAIAAALLPAAGPLRAAPPAPANELTFTKEVTSPVRHCNSADLQTSGKCRAVGPNRYQITYAYWVQNRTGSTRQVQIYDDIQKEFGTDITIIRVANAEHSTGGLYDIDDTVDSDGKDSDNRAETPATNDDDDAIDVLVNSAFTGATGGDIALLPAAQPLPANKMLVVVATFEVELPTPLPTKVDTQATLGDGTETPADDDTANIVTFYIPARIKTGTLGGAGCATGADPVGNELVQNGDFSAVVSLDSGDTPPRTLTTADKATLRFDSDLPYMGSGEDLYPDFDTGPGVIGINQHAMLGHPTEQMPPHTGPNNWLMYAHKATGDTNTVWKQSFTGLTANEEYQFSVLASNALFPGFKENASTRAIYGPTVRLKVQGGNGDATTMSNAEVTIPLETTAEGDFWQRLVGTFTPTGDSATVSIEVTAGNDAPGTSEFDVLGLTGVSLKSCRATTGGTAITGGTGDANGSGNSGEGDGGGGGGGLSGLLLGLLGLGAYRHWRR